MSNKKRSNSAAPAPGAKDTKMVRSNTSVAMSGSKDAEYTGKGRYLPDGTLNIAGRWKSPGPGKYLLPPCVGYVNHDFTIGRRPAYSIGNKWSDLTKQSCSPGPIYNPDAHITRVGREKGPAYAIASRPKEYSLWSSPGPSQYAPERHVDPAATRAPAYTIGSKHKHLEIPAHPVGPNQYSLKNTIGNRNFPTNIKTAPAFSMSSRTNFMSTTYGMMHAAPRLYYPDIDVIKTKPPKYSIAGRNYPPEMSLRIPGPNQYKADSTLVKRRAPAVTMGIRHSEYCSTGLPAHINSSVD